MEDKRRFRRVAFKEPVQFRTKNHTEPEGCVAFDLSEGGLRIITLDFIPLNEEIALTLPLEFSRQVEVQGRVKWIQKMPHAESYQVGLEFAAAPEDRQAETLAEYIQAQ